jgi:hypothetical protein
MTYLLFLFLLSLGVLFNRVIKLKPKQIYALVWCYLIVGLLVNISFGIILLPVAKPALLIKLSSLFLGVGSILGYLLLGWVFAYSILHNTYSILHNKEHVPPVANDFFDRISRFVLLSASLITGFNFVLEGYSKTVNRQNIMFFMQSGYSYSFLNFIMVCEILGGIGIIFHAKLKTGSFSSIGLLIIMIGAVVTHINNRDSYLDSFPAVVQFITLLLILFLYKKQARSN